MRTIFSQFAELWPRESQEALGPLLSKVRFLFYPEEINLIRSTKKTNDIVIIMNAGSMKETIELLSLGFEHCVRRERPDFTQELLAASLMVARPEAFSKKPIPFFFTGFANTNSDHNTDTNLSIDFRRNTEKSGLLEKLDFFLQQKPELQGLTDLCIQIADELITNALYNAPVDFKGEQEFKDLSRTDFVELPANKASTLFACFSDYRLIIGCEDQYGSLKKNLLMSHLEETFDKDKAKPRNMNHAGAGLGLRYVIENCANFYLYCERGKKSLVACALLLKGLKANLNAKKHLHLSIR